MATSLALTGSLGPFSVALRVDGQPVVVREPSGRPDLTSVTHDLCAEAGVAPGDVSEVRLDIGPGSYTGLRVAVTFANVLRSLGSVRVLATTTFELMAAANADVEHDDPTVLHPILDARRGRYHHARLQVAPDQISVSSPAAAQPCDEVLASITTDEVVLAGPELLPTLAPACEAAGAALTAARPSSASDLFDPRIAFQEATEDLQPLYLMGSYAEEPKA